MNKAYSNVYPALIEYVGRGFWRIRWAVNSTTETINDETRTNYEYMEKEFNYKPSVDEIKELVLTWHNNEIDTKIISGFTWKDMPIWLSAENQFNYKAAFDLAIQTNGQNLPITFKFGTTENPIYYTFTDLGDIQDFYTSSVSYINSTLAEGWQTKDSIDFTVYK